MQGVKIAIKTIETIVVTLFVFSISNAQAILDPCAKQERTLSVMDRYVTQAQSWIFREQERLDRVQNQVAFRLSDLQAAIGFAQADAAAAGSYFGGNVLGCGISLFFGGRGGCFSGAVRSGITARARADARVRAAQSRYENYAIYSQGYIFRQNQRVANMQQTYNQRVAQYQTAQAQLEQCRVSPLSVTTNTTISGNNVTTTVNPGVVSSSSSVGTVVG